MLVIFDLDDTLIDTSDLFWRVREEFISTIYSGHDTVDEIRNVFENEDTINIQEYGFHPERYGRTMFNIIDSLVRSNKLKDSNELRNEVDKIGKKISEEIPELIDGAIDVLGYLHETKKYKLALITRGSFEVQQKKIANYGLKKYFDYIDIVQYKDSNIFRKAIRIFNETPESTWIIGDSIRSDINPGLHLNANCIHFQYKHDNYNWIQEHGDTPYATNYYKVDTLKDIPDIIKKHDIKKNFIPVESRQGKVDQAKMHLLDLRQ